MSKISISNTIGYGLEDKFGKFSDIAGNEPVIVEKTRRKTIVSIAFEEFERPTQSRNLLFEPQMKADPPARSCLAWQAGLRPI